MKVSLFELTEPWRSLKFSVVITDRKSGEQVAEFVYTMQDTATISYERSVEELMSHKIPFSMNRPFGQYVIWLSGTKVFVENNPVEVRYFVGVWDGFKTRKNLVSQEYSYHNFDDAWRHYQMANEDTDLASWDKPLYLNQEQAWEILKHTQYDDMDELLVMCKEYFADGCQTDCCDCTLSEDTFDPMMPECDCPCACWAGISFSDIREYYPDLSIDEIRRKSAEEVFGDRKHFQLW